ncbi:glycosyltransferase family 2 protein [Aliikangiella coralliicola]|uniref:Glycosyltransferase family 2 protein n=1 Tax=Aliikangiella coralliicola TaxID=2592383 RepID=A0A545UF71_9GAMM|nr:glycosyltransferase family 2 protein [Aliikangiella coralliicola]TQV88126.1 glycosyltransferase family 2 protein [Aliikangiella coralliicola]
MYRGRRVSAVIPALNEQLAIGKVVQQLNSLKNANGLKIIDDVIVCDNGSNDNTAQVAEQSGARVIQQATPGYGIACLTALSIVKPCEIILFVDGDDSCFIEQTTSLLAGIVNGDNLAIGSRVKGNVEKGALTSIQKFGNALAAFLIRRLWHYDITDLGPFRAIKTSTLKKLDMQDQTFGWTVEMQIKAIQLGFKISEYPVDSKVRIGQSKISGTIKGSIKAGFSILTMIAKLRLMQRKTLAKFALEDS